MCRLRTFEEAIKKERIDIKQIRALAFEGIPEKKSLRPCYWKVHPLIPLPRSAEHPTLHPPLKTALRVAGCCGRLLTPPPQILLNYLPFDQKGWPTYLEKQRRMYRDWVKELVVDPHSKRVRNRLCPLRCAAVSYD